MITGRTDVVSPGTGTINTESDLFELSRSYPGERRHREQQIFGKASQFAETKFDAAEVGVVSQVNGEIF
jgi:hypothetical protein